MDKKFDEAIELLEITDISKLKVEDLPKLEKKAKLRWHPDKVAHTGNTEAIKEYTQKFQKIEECCQIIYNFLSGAYQAGEAFTGKREAETHKDPEEIIRENAPSMQSKLREVWSSIKAKGHKWHRESVILSDGFLLRDLLDEDFKVDIAVLAQVSLFYGIFIFSIIAGIASAINQVLGYIGFALLMGHIIACILAFLPLSRFWLPEVVTNIMIKFVDFGLIIFYWAEGQGKRAANWQDGDDPELIQQNIQNTNKTGIWFLLAVWIPLLQAKIVKYVVLFPIYEIAKVIWGDKVLGVVKKDVNYYANVAEWYIDELLAKTPSEMTSDNLFDLSYIYSELSDIKN